nr:hypothetical protein [Tanacetum cinerariifolium]
MVINSPCLTDKKELATPGQTATGKELSNPLMAGSLPKTTLPTKLVDDEVRIQALVDGKRVNIKESSIRRILMLDDVEGTSCLTNTEIFKGLARIGFVQLIINHQLGDMTHHKDIFATPSLTKKVFANMKRVVLDLESEVLDIKSTYKAKIEKLESRVERLEEENKVLKELKGVHYIVDSDEPVMEKEKSIIDVNDEDHADVEEVHEVVKAAKLITKVVTTAGVDVNVASVQDTPITAAESTKVIVPRKRRGVIIQEPEETTTIVTVQLKVQAKGKGKAILIKEPKPLKRQVKIKLDKEVARQLEAELNADINWNAMIKQVKRSKILTNAVMKYQALKRKPLTKSQARRNMIIYLKNMTGYKMDYFKGMSYDKIIPLFKKHYNYNQAFVNEVNEGIKVPEQEVRQEKEVEKESSKREDDDDDVYTYAIHLASKIPIIDYKIHTERNRPYFKIITANGNHRLDVEDESEMSLELLRLVRR